MKTFLKILAGIILALVVAVFIISEKYHYEKSIVISAPVEKVYQNLNSMKAFNQWNPWMDLDPNLKMQYTGNSGEIGDKYCWQGNDDVGEGCQELTALVPNQKQSTKMQFIKPFEDVATSDIVLTPQGNSTKVTWSMDCDLEKPMNLMKLFMDYQMGKAYGKGLDKLKALSEK